MSSRTARPDPYVQTIDQAYPAFLTEGRGLCADDPFPNDFTEEGDRPWQRAARERARSVCAVCPFKTPCRDWATGTNQRGMYGATTFQERKLRAARLKQLAGS